ncbi:MAG TPA: hypothetical protein PLT64_01465 [Syntrophales bacterium]|nr:hypothetical protein [Syntrophales bacterium]HOL58519.1 hypothetical protein [Syntrophales bacterium]HPO34873.1 hypothetical protein [Syntrophales bacterium]
MLMLTHSWLLAHYLGKEKFNRKLQDLYVYNICPDFLPAGPVFSPRLTHGAPRFRPIPPEFQGANFIVFHLMVDDISHYGLIKARPDEEFNPDAEGYSYLKGIPLRGPLMDFHQTYGNPIDLAQAAYQSHMVIEMTFDLALYWGAPEESRAILEYMCEAFRYVWEEKRDEFAQTVGWFYDVAPNAVIEALVRCHSFYDHVNMAKFMTLEGRVNTFFSKFAPLMNSTGSRERLTSIMEEGITLVRNFPEFLAPTLGAIRRTGFSPFAG